MLKTFTTAAAIVLTFAGNTLFAQTFKADTSKSTIAWLGKKVTGQHNGFVKLSSGSLTLDGDKIKAGNFEADMTTINCKDLEGEWNEKLIGHLKGEDFFSVEKFPKANFVLTESKKQANGSYLLKGNLTIKGITKPASFPATLTKSGDNTIITTSTIVIDRTLYDIRYGSKSFFNNIGDKAIDNDFTLTVNLVANK